MNRLRPSVSSIGPMQLVRFAMIWLVALAALALSIRNGREVIGALAVTRVDNLEVTGTTDATGVITARAGVRLTAPSTGPIFTSGSGVPASTATRGSLYLRTDTAQVYQNTDGATTWSQVGAGGMSWTNSDLQYAPYNDPTSPNALDDEFNGGTLDAKWTGFAGDGSVTNTVANSSVTITKPFTSQCVYGYRQAFSPGASAFTFEVRLNLAKCSAGGFMAAGIGVTDGTRYAFGGIMVNGGSPTLGVHYWSTATTAGGEVKTGIQLPEISAPGGFRYPLDLWVRLQRSGNDLTVTYSPNGYDFGLAQTYTNVLSGWGAITDVGMMGQSTNGGFTVQPRYFYFRKIL